eukprot:scaffold108863_cov23-Tisochrysis_lutea.AAC.1
MRHKWTGRADSRCRAISRGRAGRRRAWLEPVALVAQERNGCGKRALEDSEALTEPLRGRHIARLCAQQRMAQILYEHRAQVGLHLGGPGETIGVRGTRAHGISCVLPAPTPPGLFPYLSIATPPSARPYVPSCCNSASRSLPPAVSLSRCYPDLSSHTQFPHPTAALPTLPPPRALRIMHGLSLCLHLPLRPYQESDLTATSSPHLRPPAPAARLLRKASVPLSESEERGFPSPPHTPPHS